METVYNKIVDTFNDHPEVFTDRELPVPRTIDIYMGQPDDPEQFEVLCPALYINWKIDPGIENGADILTLEFHVLQEPAEGTENYSNKITEGLLYLRLIKAVKYTLNRLRAGNITPLKWAGERPAVTPFFQYHILSYTCNIDSYTDSLHRPAYAEAIGEDVNITSAKLKRTKDPVDEFY